MTPRITIVTPTLNRARYLGEAIESVLTQGYADLEHIVVDGMSSDGTVELLARYPHLRVIREPDTGVYDALNKGIRAATGDVIGHLNSDDTYAVGVFARVGEACADPAVEAVHGGADLVAEDGRLIRRFVSPEEIALSFANATVASPIPNARFFRRSFYERVGLYDVRYRVAADRDFLFRAACAAPRSVNCTEIFYRYRWHDDSLTFSADPVRETRWRAEYVELAERFLEQPGVPAEARTCARRWHLRESTTLAVDLLMSGRRGEARAWAQRGCAVNALWPLVALKRIAGWALGARRGSALARAERAPR